MKVSDDLFWILSSGTYFKVLTPYKVIKFTRDVTPKATLSNFPLDPSKMLFARFGYFAGGLGILRFFNTSVQAIVSYYYTLESTLNVTSSPLSPTRNLFLT